MSLYRVQCTVTAKSTYTVEVEAPTEARAEGAAISMWRDKTSPDFQVDKIDSAEAESTQISWQCEVCGVEITEAQDRTGQGCCAKCDAEWVADETAYAARRTA